MNRQIELNVGHFCNNRCVFCVSGQLTQRGQANSYPLEHLTAQLDSASAKGIGTVTLLGGEPTLHDKFFELLDHAVALDFDEIVLFTNGARTGDRTFVEDACRRGDFTWRFSVQGGTEEVHDRVTQRKGAYARIAHGMSVLHELGQKTTANMCVNAWNVASLPELPKLLGPMGVESFHADMVRPHSVGDRTPDEVRGLLSPYADVAASLRAMLASFARHAPDVDVRIGNLPFCVMPDHADRIEHGGVRTDTITGDADKGLELTQVRNKYAYQATHRTHPAGCQGCSYRPRCVGVPDAYLAAYGPDEFQAIRTAPMGPARRDPVSIPGPRAHLAGTLWLVGLFERLAGGNPHSDLVRDLLGTTDDLPKTGDGGLKYDAYLARGQGQPAWGFTVNTRWETHAIARFERFMDALPADYAWDRIQPLLARTGMLTLGVGFDAPDAPPRLKLYLQEDLWGTGVASRDEAAEIVGAPLPSWIPRVDVLTANLHPGGELSWKAYTGGGTASHAARGAPAEVLRLARRMERYSPLGPAWYYVTARLDPEVRYAMNKIYDHVRIGFGPSPTDAWRDLAALFVSAGRGEAYQQVLREVVKMKGLRVTPTASALEDEGRSVDLYCAAWVL